MIHRLVRSTDFERVLKTRSRASSAHFALHHLDDAPTRRGPSTPELSTSAGGEQAVAVDGVPRRPGGVWLGAVVPKRHARRAVTRSLLKRQIRSVVADGESALAGGLWVVRLRAPFDRARFGSAASDALRREARSELQQLLSGAAGRRPRR